MIGASVSRQELFDAYQRSPESAPLKIPSLTYTTLAEDYCFERLMARIPGATAAELIDNATRDAQEAKKGFAVPLAAGIITLLSGMAAMACVMIFVPLAIVGIVLIYFGMGWIRSSNDKIRRASYDRRFASDVARYAVLVAAQKVWPSGS